MNFFARRLTFVALLVVFGILAARAQTAPPLPVFSFTPSVLSATGPRDVLFAADFASAPTRVALEFSPTNTTIDLHDDGQAGDRVAGDRTFSALLPTAAIRSAMRADDVNRAFVGFLTVFNGTSQTLRGNIFVDVTSNDIPSNSVTRLAADVQATTRVVNIVDPTYLSTGDIARVTQTFYRWFGDDYDFLNIISTPSRFQNRSHFSVKNDVDGIGLSRANNTARYGSAGRLLGISLFPIPYYFDGAETAYIHELGHQWVNFLNATPFASGIPHWPLSSMASGVMGFSIGGAGGEGGSFACSVVDADGVITLTPRSGAAVYNDLELYLMGMLPAAGVRTQVVFSDQAANMQCAGQRYTGAVTRVSAQDVVTRFGPRIPAAGDAPTRFRIATILVSRDGLESAEAMALDSWFADRAEWRAPVPIHSGFLKETGNPFYVATGQRGSLDTRIALAQPDFSIVPATGTATVTAGTTASFTVSVLPTRQSFDDAVALTCGGGAGLPSCAFAPSSVTPGQTGRDVALSVVTAVGMRGTHVITVRGSAGALQHTTAIAVTVQ